MKFITLAAMLAIAPVATASSQEKPSPGQMTLAADELVVETARPHMGIVLTTVDNFPCADLRIAAPYRVTRDSVVITLGDIVDSGLCEEMFAPAHAYVPLALDPGTYTVAVTRGKITDHAQLRVTADTLIVRPLGTPTFIRPDTTPFLRAPERSFLLSCGNGPELCTDVGDWIARQPGIEQVKFPPNAKIAFPRYGGYDYEKYQLFTYVSDSALGPVIRCMRFLSDTLNRAVGVGIVLQTADGAIYRAESMRSLDQQHISTPQRVSGSSACPIH